MKNIILNKLFNVLFSFLIFLSIPAKADTIKKTYHLSKPTIKKQADGTDLLYFNQSYQIGQVGEPTIPVLPIVLLLPPGNIAKSISIKKNNNQMLIGRYKLSPKQSPKQSLDSQDQFEYNTKIYSSQNPLQNPEPTVKTHFYCGHSIALSYFCPIEYVPAEESISYYSELVITLETEYDISAIHALEKYRYSDQIKHQLSYFVHNFDEKISSYPLQNSETLYDYLIITIDDFIDDYKPLLNFHNELGLKTKIVSVEEIYLSILGEDEPEKIRNYIIEQYQQQGVTNVLLAGDADLNSEGQRQVPIRNFYCEVISAGDTIKSPTIPTDLYYSALDGNWNQNGNEKWGEPGEDDLLPEINVARICADNSEEISAIINKIINYQIYPILEDATKMLMVGEKLYNDPLSFGADYLDQTIGTKDVNGYYTTGMSENLNFTYLYDKTLGSWQFNDLLQYINNGCNIIHHAGHSNSGYNMRMHRNDIIDENFKKVDGIQHLNPIIYSHGCSPAAIDVIDSNGDDCIAEMMLEIDNFASAFIGNTRYGWFNEGQNEGPSLHLHREFIDALYDKKVSTIGAAHKWSRINTAAFVTLPDQWEPGALRWCFYGCNVLGDAAMPVWTNEINQFQNINYPDDISGNFQIQTGVSDSKVTFSNDGEIIATAISDQNGTAFFNLDSTLTFNDLKLSITAHNYKPFIIEFSSQPNPTTVSPPSVTNNLTFNLKPAYPNPFNPTTNIEFSITKNSRVKLIVYNTLGQQIRTIVEGQLEAGIHKKSWDGRDDFGNLAANGLYFFKLQTNEGSRLGSCVLLK